MSDIGGRGSENHDFRSDILFACPLTFYRRSPEHVSTNKEEIKNFPGREGKGGREFCPKYITGASFVLLRLLPTFQSGDSNERR